MWSFRRLTQWVLTTKPHSRLLSSLSSICLSVWWYDHFTEARKSPSQDFTGKGHPVLPPPPPLTLNTSRPDTCQQFMIVTRGLPPAPLITANYTDPYQLPPQYPPFHYRKHVTGQRQHFTTRSRPRGHFTPLPNTLSRLTAHQLPIRD